MGHRAAMHPIVASRGRCWMSRGVTIYIFPALYELLRAIESGLECVRCSMFEHIEGGSCTCKYLCVFGGRGIADCGWSRFFWLGQCNVGWYNASRLLVGCMI